jgi:predicted double-glycine peptidase
VAAGLPAGATVHVVSMTDEKWLAIVRQRTDFSCGAAALATLLTYAYGVPVSERGVMQAMLDVSDLAMVEQRGFSLLEMKGFLASIGMRGVGYQIEPATLAKLKVPSIALLDVDGYAHFVVVKSAATGYVFVADPARGNLTVSTPDFARAWNGIAFVVEAPEYRRNNPLLAVRYPASAGRLVAGTAPSLDPVTDNLLMSVGSFAPNRLP